MFMGKPFIPLERPKSMAKYCTGDGDYVSIPIGNNGLMAIVDIEFEWLSRWRWSPWKTRFNLHFYAVRGIRVDKKVFQLHMSRLICCALPSERVSHVDGYPLNNRCSNLQLNGVAFLDTDREVITKEKYYEYLNVYISINDKKKEEL